MKYTYKTDNGSVRTVDIPDAELVALGKSIGSRDVNECVQLWLFDHGYTDDETVDELTKKAKENKCGAKAAGNKQKKPRKPRDPDMVKRGIIEALTDFCPTLVGVENVRVENPERIVAFSLGGEDYTFTLTRKRKPKN